MYLVWKPIFEIKTAKQGGDSVPTLGVQSSLCAVVVYICRAVWTDLFSYLFIDLIGIKYGGLHHGGYHELDLNPQRPHRWEAPPEMIYV